MKHLNAGELEQGLEKIRRSPEDNGAVEMIVRRPDVDGREILVQAELDMVQGLAGDTWMSRGSSRTSDGSAHPDMQLTIMNARVIALVATSRERWPLAGWHQSCWGRSEWHMSAAIHLDFRVQQSPTHGACT